jgi:hypothetical protein
VVRVDLRDGERHVVVKARVRGVRRDDVARLAERRFDPLADAGGERREDQIDIVRHRLGRRLDDLAVGDVRRDGSVERPLRRLPIRLPHTRRRGCERRDIELLVAV